MMILQKGDQAPQFNLRNQAGEKVDSTQIDGKILLAFHPLAFTGVCTDQMRDLELHYDEFEEKGITPFGVSVDAHPSKNVWANSIGLKKLDILADFNPKGELAKACGIYIEEAGISDRAVVLMDQNEVIWSKHYETSERPAIEEILDHLED